MANDTTVPVHVLLMTSWTRVVDVTLHVMLVTLLFL